MQADAADHGNADGLSQGILQSEAALVKQKQQVIIKGCLI